MADSTLATKYSDLRSIIGAKAYGKRNPADFTPEEAADVELVMKSGLRNVYYCSTLGEKYAHEWSFLRPTDTLTTTPPYTTGTIEVEDGDVILTGGTWPAWATEGELLINGMAYEIDSRESDTELLLVDETVNADAGTTFQLGRYAYDLPDDYAGLEEGFTYRPGTSGFRGRINLVGEQQIRSCPWSGRVGRPANCALRPRRTDGTAGQRWQVVFDPVADGEYKLHYRYRIDPDALASDDYPYGGVALAETIIESCLASFERRHDDFEGVHSKNFPILLATAISHDRMVSSPATLGYDGTGQRDVMDLLNRRGDIVTYNGQLPWPLDTSE